MLDWTHFFAFPCLSRMFLHMFRCPKKVKGAPLKKWGIGKGGVRSRSCLSGFEAHIPPPFGTRCYALYSSAARGSPWEWAMWGNPINWAEQGGHWSDRGQEGTGLCSASVNGSKEALHQGVCHRLPGTTPSARPLLAVKTWLFINELSHWFVVALSKSERPKVPSLPLPSLLWWPNHWN